MRKLAVAVLAMCISFPLMASNGRVAITFLDNGLGFRVWGEGASILTQLLQGVPHLLSSSVGEAAKPAAVKPANAAPKAANGPYDVKEADREMPNGLDAFAKSEPSSEQDIVIEPAEHFDLKGNQITCFLDDQVCEATFDSYGVFSAPEQKLATPEHALVASAWVYADGGSVAVTFDGPTAQFVFDSLDRSTSGFYSKDGQSIHCTSALGEAQCTFYVDAKGTVSSHL